MLLLNTLVEHKYYKNIVRLHVTLLAITSSYYYCSVH